MLHDLSAICHLCLYKSYEGPVEMRGFVSFHIRFVNSFSCLVVLGCYLKRSGSCPFRNTSWNVRWRTINHMELRVEFAKNYCSAAKEPQLCLSPKNGNGDLVNRWWERVCDVRLGTDVCLQKCTENQENISSWEAVHVTKKMVFSRGLFAELWFGVVG